MDTGFKVAKIEIYYDVRKNISLMVVFRFSNTYSGSLKYDIERNHYLKRRENWELPSR